MNEHILAPLSQFEAQFLNAVNDEAAMEMFRSHWSTWHADFVEATGNGTISQEALTMGVHTASRIQLLSEHFLDVDAKFRSVTSSFESDIEAIFNQDGLPHASISSSHFPSSALPTQSHTTSSAWAEEKRHPCPPYIASAYKWLRHHLHKPYPTPEEIHTICVNSCTEEKRIRNWFISARQRMGWTKIAKEHFHNDREDTADAAYRALIETNSTRPLDPKLMYKFVKMQVVAEGMYSASFKPTHFVGGLGATLVGMSREHKACIEEMRQQAIEEEDERRETEHQMKMKKTSKRGGSLRRSVSLYPSPESSPERSIAPTLVSDTDETEAEYMPSDAAAGRKRRRSSSSDEPNPVSKRSRSDKRPLTPPIDSSISLPSPPASADENTTGVFDYWTSTEDSITDSQLSIPSPPIVRKRRLSNADANVSPKRPRGFVVGPRLHAVSDPLPAPSAAFESMVSQDWRMNDFASLFEFPSAVTSQSLDPAEPLDIELFTNWTNSSSSSDSSQSPASYSPSPIPMQGVDLPASELYSSTSPGFDLTNAGTDFEQLLQDFSIPQAMEPSLIVPTAVQQPSPQSHAPSTAIADDWSQMSMYVDPTPSEITAPAIASAQPYGFIDFSAIPNFDPSMLKPPSPPSPAEIIAQSESDAKRAKLEQWRAHLEAAKKLEQELIST